MQRLEDTPEYRQLIALGTEYGMEIRQLELEANVVRPELIDPGYFPESMFEPSSKLKIVRRKSRPFKVPVTL